MATIVRVYVNDGVAAKSIPVSDTTTVKELESLMAAKLVQSEFVDEALFDSSTFRLHVAYRNSAKKKPSVLPPKDSVVALWAKLAKKNKKAEKEYLLYKSPQGVELPKPSNKHYAPDAAMAKKATLRAVTSGLKVVHVNDGTTVAREETVGGSDLVTTVAVAVEGTGENAAATALALEEDLTVAGPRYGVSVSTVAGTASAGGVAPAAEPAPAKVEQASAAATSAAAAKAKTQAKQPPLTMRMQRIRKNGVAVANKLAEDINTLQIRVIEAETLADAKAVGLLLVTLKKKLGVELHTGVPGAGGGAAGSGEDEKLTQFKRVMQGASKQLQEHVRGLAAQCERATVPSEVIGIAKSVRDVKIELDKLVADAGIAM